jgi:hypothetical protein
MQRGGRLVDQRHDVRCPTNLLDLVALFKLFADGQEIDRGAGFMQAREGFPNPAVADNKKVVRLEELSDIVIGFRVNQHSAEYGFFRLSAVWCLNLGMNNRVVRLQIAHRFISTLKKSPGRASSPGVSIARYFSSCWAGLSSSSSSSSLSSSCLRFHLMNYQYQGFVKIFEHR